MIITDLSVKRPVFALVISLLLIVFGVISFLRLPLRQYPDINAPVVSVETRYTGAASATVESRITTLIEDSISGIEGVRYMESVSEDGRSLVTINFLPERDIDGAANDVRDRVARVVADLPEEADPPEVFKVDANTDVIIWINLASTTLSQTELTDYAERYLVDQLSILDGVARVRVGGGRTQAMRIWLKPDAMAARGITAADVEAALRAENVELPAGLLESQTREYTLRLERGYSTPEEIARLVIRRSATGAPIRIGDVAQVMIGAEDERSELRGNGEIMVGLGVVQQSTANTLEVARAVKAKIEQLRPSLPEGTDFYDSYDASLFIEASIQEVYQTLAIAILMVVVVIYLFLGTLRATLVPAVTVPVSLISACIVLYALGYSINLLTLLALVLAIGLVVDDAIIMLENIQRRVNDGERRLKAAYLGARQVGFAVLATTLVLIAVFVPMTFLTGATGRLFTEFAVAVIAAVGFSSIVALTLSPVMCAHVLARSKTDTRVTRAIDRTFERLSTLYRHALRLTLRHSRYVLLSTLVMIGAIVALLAFLPQEFAPKEDRGVFFVRFNAPEGASFDYSQSYARRMEADLMPLLDSGEAKRVLVRVPGNFSSSATVNSGIGIVVLEDWAERSRNVFEITGALIPSLMSYEGVTSFPITPQGFGQSTFSRPVEFVIGAGTYEELATWRDIMLEALKDYPGLVAIDTDYKETKPQFSLHIDKERAAALGLSATQIGRTLETLLGSRKVTTYLDRGEEYDVILEALRDAISTPQDILGLYVRSETTGALVRLDAVVSAEAIATSGQLNRYNRRRALTLSADIASGYTLGDVLTHLEATVREKLPETATIDYKGQSLEFRDTGAQTFFIFLMALCIVFLVLSAQFESFVHPLTIMLSVPLALLGGLAGLWVFGLAIGIYSQIGLLMLIGLAAKNGILIVEFANQLREEGLAFAEALEEAARLRLRPILMTSLTTVAGAVPLVLSVGAGAESRFLLGVVIVCGVTCATVLTLFVIPAAYQTFARYAGLPHDTATKLEGQL